MKNLIFFTGEETFLLEREKRAWKEAFLKKHGDLNWTALDAERVPVAEILSALETPPFLAEKRLVFIENLPEKPPAREPQGEKSDLPAGKAGAQEKREDARTRGLEKLMECLKSLPESTVAVLVQARPDKRKSFYKELIKTAEVRSFDPLEGAALTRWVTETAGTLGLPISPSIAGHLLALTGPDLWRIASELRKLAAYADGKALSAEEIESLVVPHGEASIFRFTDAIGARDDHNSLRLMQQSLRAEGNINQLFFMVVRQFRLMLQTKAALEKEPGLSGSALAARLGGINPYAVRSLPSQAARFTVAELKSAYQKLLEIDRALKTGLIKITAERPEEMALLVERFLWEALAPAKKER